MSLTSYRAAPPRVGVVGLCALLCLSGLRRPGGDLLSRVLRRSTIGAEGFHGRVRDGIGCRLPARATRSSSLSKLNGLVLVRLFLAMNDCCVWGCDEVGCIELYRVIRTG